MSNGIASDAQRTAEECELARRARGDRAAFGELYDRYLGPVYGYVYRRLRNPEEAEDVTSLIFTKALAAIASFRDDAPSFRAWLFGIAHNAVVDAVRRRRPNVPLDADGHGHASVVMGPEELAMRRDDLDRLAMLLARLPPEQAWLVELRLAGLTDREIAEVLGRSHGAIRIAQYRALKQLRALVHASEERYR